MVDLIEGALEAVLDLPFMKRDHPRAFEVHMKRLAREHALFLQHIRDHGPDHLMNCAEGFNLRCDSAGDNTGYFNSQKAFLDHLIERLQTPDKENKR